MKQSSKQNQENLDSVFFVKVNMCSHLLDNLVHKLWENQELNWIIFNSSEFVD